MLKEIKEWYPTGFVMATKTTTADSTTAPTAIATAVPAPRVPPVSPTATGERSL